MSRGKLQTKQKSISASSLTSSDSRTFNMFSLIEFFQELSDELLRLVGISSQISKPTREKPFFVSCKNAQLLINVHNKIERWRF